MEAEANQAEADENKQADQEENKEPVQEQVEDEGPTDYTKDPRIRWMIKHCDENLDSFNEAEMLTPAKLGAFHDFLQDKQYKKIYMWIDINSGEFLTDFDSAPKFYELKIKSEDFQVVFFLKKELSTEITIKNITDVVMASAMDRDPLDDLLNKMNMDYVGKLLGENDWPDGVRKEFIANLHKFMAALTEASYMS